MNNRLDFISNIHEDGIALMTAVRQAYINLDEVLRHLTENSIRPIEASSARTLALSRTNLETSLQYAIKTLCLQYEIKE